MDGSTVDGDGCDIACGAVPRAESLVASRKFHHICVCMCWEASNGALNGDWRATGNDKRLCAGCVCRKSDSTTSRRATCCRTGTPITRKKGARRKEPSRPSRETRFEQRAQTESGTET